MEWHSVSGADPPKASGQVARRGVPLHATISSGRPKSAFPLDSSRFETTFYDSKDENLKEQHRFFSFPAR